MDDSMKQALDIVKAQAQVRVMEADEIASMIRGLFLQLKSMPLGGPVPERNGEVASAGVDPKKAIREKSITCLECGKTFKILTKKHLALHGLTPAEYLIKHGYPRKTSLVAKALQRQRRRKMQELKIWEKRGKH